MLDRLRALAVSAESPVFWQSTLSIAAIVALTSNANAAPPSIAATTAPGYLAPRVRWQPAPVSQSTPEEPLPSSRIQPPDASALQADAFEPPFPSEALALSEVLKIALEKNYALRGRAIDVSVSEATILSSLGDFDVILTGSAGTSYQKQTPRGSTFVLSTGSSAQRFSFGAQRKLETGGSLELSLGINRSLTDQPINFFDPTAGSATLAEYILQPRLQFTHPLLRGLGVRVNRAEIEKAQIARTNAEALEQQAAQEMVRDLLTAYWDVLFAKRDLEIKRASVKLAQEQLARTQAQVTAGRLSPVDAKAVEQSLATRENEVITAETTLLDSSVALRTLMGDRFSEREILGVLPLTDPQNPSFDDPPIQSEIDRVLAANPQVRQLELALATRRLDELQAANQRLPQLDFSLGFSARGRSADATEDTQTGRPPSQGSWGEAFRNFIADDVRQNGVLADYSVDASLTFNWNVQNRSARGRHQQVQLEIERAQINLEQLHQTLASNVIRMSYTRRSARKRLDVARLAVDLAKENLAAEEARFRVGRSTNYDVLFRIDELSKAEIQALSAQIELLKAHIQLQALSGDILPAYGLELASRAQH